MTNTSITIGLQIGYYDSVAETEAAGEEVTLATPILEVFAFPSNAIAKNEGINIVEGDLWFFGYDGSPLQACFTEEPYVDTKRLVYFPGVYSLQRGAGENLQEAIAKILAFKPSPHTQIVVRMCSTNSSPQVYGWSDIRTMKEGIEDALKILPSNMIKRLVFE